MVINAICFHHVVSCRSQSVLVFNWRLLKDGFLSPKGFFLWLLFPSCPISLIKQQTIGITFCHLPYSSCRQSWHRSRSGALIFCYSGKDLCVPAVLLCNSVNCHYLIITSPRIIQALRPAVVAFYLEFLLMKFDFVHVIFSLSVYLQQLTTALVCFLHLIPNKMDTHIFNSRSLGIQVESQYVT